MERATAGTAQISNGSLVSARPDVRPSTPSCDDLNWSVREQSHHRFQRELAGRCGWPSRGCIRSAKSRPAFPIQTLKPLGALQADAPVHPPHEGMAGHWELDGGRSDPLDI